MTELDYYKLFLDWLGQQGKVTPKDIQEFDAYLRAQKTAKQWVDENFKGMF